MTRLRRTSAAQSGWSRRRAGRGFAYRDEHGEKLATADVERVKSLAIPPAWTDVWICPHENGHLQAVGTDEAGRRQYLYHPEWRLRRDRAKFRRVIQVAEELPDARRRIAADLELEGMPLDRARAAAVRLIDLGCFRIGGDAYADENGSYGLTTLERRHVHRRGDALVFAFRGKSGIEHSIEVADERAIAAIEAMRKRRGGERLFAYREGKDWRVLDAAAVNAYLSEVFEGDLTAKDFRTWHATVRAACSLALTEEAGVTKASRKRAMRAAAVEVSDYLGNTPTVARSSYIDPRVFDRYEEGRTIDPHDALDAGDGGEGQDRAERAVLALLAG